MTERDTVASYGLRHQGRMQHHIREARRCSVEHGLGMLRARTSLWQVRALFAGYRDSMLLAVERLRLLRNLHHAVMVAVSAATGGHSIAWIGSQGQQRGDRRHADDKQDRDGKKAPQAVIITNGG
jgi:hypothetical protein